MQNAKDIKVIEAMERYGGSFVKALAEAFHRADANNFERLKATFFEYWHQYESIADRDANKRISLDLEDFRTLVRGGVVEQEGAKIILKDIGFDLMLSEVNDAFKIAQDESQ